MLSSLDLHDALLHLNGDRPCTILSCSLITHYIFVSQSLLPHWVGAGQLKRDLTFVSDKPAILVQLKIDSLLNMCNTSVYWPRKLRTIDIAAAEIYLEELRRQFSQNDKTGRKWSENHTTRYNSLDQHISAIMLSAEKSALRRNRETLNGAETSPQKTQNLQMCETEEDLRYVFSCNS